jgi:cytoskeletal protein RodZ
MIEMGFIAAIASVFTFVWIIVHIVATIRWPETTSEFPQTQVAYRETSSSSQAFSTGEAYE